ncbi:MAG TPA: hypothetical protein VMZ26_01015 [Pyrinomonadaceae bacterium]|nr:hypothetical protein [Pyrinomonadaceae bacterium]
MKTRCSRIIISVLAGAIFFLCTVVPSIPAQQYKLAPLKVTRSTFIEQVKALRAANPKMTPEDLVAAANALLDKNGVNFAISFDAATCDRLRKVKSEQKDPTVPLTIGATLKSVDAEGAALALPEPLLQPFHNCNCYIELPLLQVTDSDFIAVISGRNIKFHMPANFSTFEAKLLDPKTEGPVKRKWRIPFRGSPVGVSNDENVLYLAFPDPELSDISFAVFGEGVFQIATRAEAEDGGKGKLIRPSTAPSADSRTRFDRWGKSFVVSYMPPCSVKMQPDFVQIVR